MSTKIRELLTSVFSKEGLLAAALPDFEERKQQSEMSFEILNTYLDNKIALIEAGTGIGKSLAYLVPAILWAAKEKEKTVISTYTIALQEQLIYKDIPFVLQILGVDLKAVLVKGMSNYLCLRKVEESFEGKALEEWARNGKEGSRCEAPFPISSESWEKIGASADTCNSVECPHYKECFFFKARRQAQQAQIIVVNHHLLCADLAVKSRNPEQGILPPYERLVLDEAHHFEDVAMEMLCTRIDRLCFFRLFSRLFSDFCLHRFQGDGALRQRLEIDLPAQREIVAKKIAEAFDKVEKILFINNAFEKKIRIHPKVLKEIKPFFEDVLSLLRSFATTLFSLQSDLEPVREFISSPFAELQMTRRNLQDLIDKLEDFFTETEELQKIKWFERPGGFLVSVSLDISSFLHENLFSKIFSASLCSATLATSGKFAFMRRRLGIADKAEVIEQIYASPFDYEKRTLLAVPLDLPNPDEPSFVAAASKAIFKTICISRGSAFVLFTSYEMLEACYSQVLELAAQEKFYFLKQGEFSRRLLLETFKAQKHSVLFGTDSFWEGVDVAGEALSCVILVKLPFKAPNDPLMEAQKEILLKKGEDPFFHYAVPQAVIKFKQGFGRLMRKKDDYGCIVCLDKRLTTKTYGKSFLKSLPPSRLLCGSSEQIFSEMKTFYRSHRCPPPP